MLRDVDEDYLQKQQRDGHVSRALDPQRYSVAALRPCGAPQLCLCHVHTVPVTLLPNRALLLCVQRAGSHGVDRHNFTW